jgi:hypothetical protein
VEAGKVTRSEAAVLLGPWRPFECSCTSASGTFARGCRPVSPSAIGGTPAAEAATGWGPADLEGRRASMKRLALAAGRARTTSPVSCSGCPERAYQYRRGPSRLSAFTAHRSLRSRWTCARIVRTCSCLLRRSRQLGRMCDSAISRSVTDWARAIISSSSRVIVRLSMVEPPPGRCSESGLKRRGPNDLGCTTTPPMNGSAPSAVCCNR